MTARPRPVETRVATANIPVRKMTRDQAAAALRVVLDEHPHHLALQEWGPERNDVLRDAERRGFDHTRAPGGPPILWDAGRAGLLHVRALRLARAELVGHLAGRKSRLGASIATEALVEDDALGEGVVISAHLTAEVQVDGRYRTDLAHRLRVRRHQRETRRLARRARHHRARGRWVRVCLDGNFDGLQLPPLVSCWEGRKGGTLGSRAVDIVFAEQPAADVRTLVTGSDHRAVVVTYST